VDSLLVPPPLLCFHDFPLFRCFLFFPMRGPSFFPEYTRFGSNFPTPPFISPTRGGPPGRPRFPLVLSFLLFFSTPFYARSKFFLIFHPGHKISSFPPLVRAFYSFLVSFSFTLPPFFFDRNRFFFCIRSGFLPFFRPGLLTGLFFAGGFSSEILPPA